MIKYLPLLILLSCNSALDSKETAGSININTDIRDSLSSAIDSLKTDLASIKEVSDYAQEAQARIKQLEKERELAVFKSKDPVYVESLQYLPADKKDEELRKLTEKVLAYEREIARLKRKIASDSLAKISKSENYDIVPEEKPNQKSLVITLDKQIRGDGDISDQGVTVWIMPYTKKVRKTMKGYQNCQIKDLNSFGAVEANKYQGEYFFNNILPGEYLIKVCALYGNYMVINRKNDYQKVEMKISPPIQ